jgi:hypothetical protein
LIAAIKEKRAVTKQTDNRKKREEEQTYRTDCIAKKRENRRSKDRLSGEK